MFFYLLFFYFLLFLFTALSSISWFPHVRFLCLFSWFPLYDDDHMNSLLFVLPLYAISTFHLFWLVNFRLIILIDNFCNIWAFCNKFHLVSSNVSLLCREHDSFVLLYHNFMFSFLSIFCLLFSISSSFLMSFHFLFYYFSSLLSDFSFLCRLLFQLRQSVSVSFQMSFLFPWILIHFNTCINLTSLSFF